jgi:hypothetical protein
MRPRKGASAGRGSRQQRRAQGRQNCMGSKAKMGAAEEGAEDAHCSFDDVAVTTDWKEKQNFLFQPAQPPGYQAARGVRNPLSF